MGRKECTLIWGVPGDIRITGDFHGTGATNYAIWRGGEGNWYVLDSISGNGSVTQWGLSGDIPIGQILTSALASAGQATRPSVLPQ